MILKSEMNQLFWDNIYFLRNGHLLWDRRSSKLLSLQGLWFNLIICGIY